MRAVTIGRIAGVFAAAKQGKFGALGGERQRLDPGSSVGAVAERLFLAPPAAAPSVAPAGLKFDLIGVKLRSLWLCHGGVLCKSWPSKGKRSWALLSQFASPAQESVANRGAVTDRERGKGNLLIHWESVGGRMNLLIRRPNCPSGNRMKELESMTHPDHRGRKAGTVHAAPAERRARPGRFSRGRRGAEVFSEAAHV